MNNVMFHKLLFAVALPSMLFALSCTPESEVVVPVTEVTMDKDMLTLVIGDGLQLTADAFPEDATDRSIEWESSNADVVSVDQDGNVVATGEGSAVVYAVSGTAYASCNILVNQQPEKGFFYYSDGTYSKEFNTGKDCIGVIYYVGQHPNDRSDYSDSGIGMPKCHGYVVAKEDADGQCQWGLKTEALGLYPTDDSGAPIDNLSGNSGDTDWSGYKYTRTIRDFAEANDQFTEETLKGYAACYHAVNYHLAAPEHSSGWFLPAISQLYAIYQSRDLLGSLHVNASLIADNWYWSSSEYYEIPDEVAMYYSGESKNVEGRSKSSGLFIRPVVAF